MRDLAAYFASQAPKAADGTTADVATPNGEDLFLHGNPARGMPPCQGCHGADANGPGDSVDQYAVYPSLRGQSAPYVVARLTHFRDGQPSDTTNAFVMHGVAATLDDDSIQAIASWLGSLVPRKSP
jgi:cytochrome c553